MFCSWNPILRGRINVVGIIAGFRRRIKGVLFLAEQCGYKFNLFKTDSVFPGFPANEHPVRHDIDIFLALVDGDMSDARMLV